MASKPGVRRDDDGFEDIDEYFDLASENKAPAPDKAPTTQKTASSFLVSPIPPAKTVHYEEYQQPVAFDDEHSAASVGGQPETFETLGAFDDGMIDYDYEHVEADDEVSFGGQFSATAPTEKVEEEEDGPTGKKPKKQPTATKKIASKPPAAPRKTQKVEKRKVEVSAKYGTAVSDDGRRKTQRQRMAPLMYWENEKVKYGRRNSLGNFHSFAQLLGIPVIVDVERHPPAPTKQQIRSTRKRKRSSTKTSEPQGLRQAGYSQAIEVAGPLLDARTGEETEEERRLAITPDQVQFEPVTGEAFSMRTLFAEGEQITAGQLVFPPGTSKPNRNAGASCLVFTVLEGAFEATIHRTSFAIGLGGMFMVPPGNQYQLRALWKGGDSRLAFCHVRL